MSLTYRIGKDGEVMKERKIHVLAKCMFWPLSTRHLFLAKSDAGRLSCWIDGEKIIKLEQREGSFFGWRNGLYAATETGREFMLDLTLVFVMTSVGMHRRIHQISYGTLVRELSL